MTIDQMHALESDLQGEELSNARTTLSLFVLCHTNAYVRMIVHCKGGGKNSPHN